MGSGRTELAKTIFGEYKRTSGEISLNGSPININCISDAINNGICYLSEDRKRRLYFRNVCWRKYDLM